MDEAPWRPRPPWRLLGAAAAVLLGLGTWAAACLTQPVLTTPDTPDVAEAVPDPLEETVRWIVDQGPRNHTEPDTLDAIASYLSDALTAAGAEPFEQTWYAGGAKYRNVRVFFGPREGPRIVVGAHYDAYGKHAGADDNASGVAVWLDLARRLAANPPGASVELVAYSLEEPPYFRTEQMGSAVHARSLAQEGVEVTAMIALDCVGYFTDEPESQDFPVQMMRFLYSTTGNTVAVVGRTDQGELLRQVKGAFLGGTRLPAEAIAAPEEVAGIDFSDHLNYWKQGWPAVLVTDTAFYRNDRYHTAEDTPDTLDYARMAEVSRGLEAAVRMLADAPVSGGGDPPSP